MMASLKVPIVTILVGEGGSGGALGIGRVLFPDFISRLA